MDELEQIKERIDIVDLIGEAVTLKKAGRNFKALCPFHSEKTPSFVVSPERQIWHCFGGCQKGGDIFTFVMELEHIEFPEALKILAAKAGVKLTRQFEESKQTQLKDRLLSLHHLAQEYYHYLLIKHTVGDRARRYLKERGIGDAAMSTFSLGFAPQSWDNIGKFLMKKGFNDTEIKLAGLRVSGPSKSYDRFRDRIMFPLKNHRGETIAFAGRLLDKNAKEAKYINSPETPLYVKGNTLYGLDVTKEAIRKEGSAVIVEGEFDVISSFQVGVSNVVAIKGSALTEAQVSLLKRFTEKLILALDADTAGDAAARRGIEIADQAGLETQVVSIPKGKDPDEVAREDSVVWKNAIKGAVAYYDFLIQSAIARFDAREAFGKKKISDELLPVFARIDNGIVQSHYLKLLAHRLDTPEEKLFEAIKKVKSPLIVQRFRTSKQETKTTADRLELLEEHLLALVLQAKDARATLDLACEAVDPSNFKNNLVKRIFIAFIDFIDDKKTVAINDFVKILPSELVSTVDRLYLLDLEKTQGSQQFDKELQRTVVSIKQERLRRKITELATNISMADTQRDQETLEELNNELKQATELLKTLAA